MIRHRQFAAAILCVAALLGRAARADAFDPPAGYYDSATGTGATLKSQLTTIMSTGHILRTYGDLRDSAAITDVDPLNSNNILLMYNRASVSNIWNDGVTWNREHIWPVSLQGGSNPSNSTTGHRADPHSLRPANPVINSNRGNSPFGLEGDSGAHGVSDIDSDYYYPGDVDRGDAARSLFYSATRWSSLGLTLVNSSPGNFEMGDLASLIQWHFQDVPDTFERRRNQAVFSQVMNPDYYTNNRNAFVDRPEFVWSVFVDQANDSRITINGTTPDANGGTTRNVDLGRAFVGSTVEQSFTLNKTGNDGTYYEVTATGAATSSLSGRFNSFRTNQTDSDPINIGITTPTSGLRSGTVTVNNLDVTTSGGTGRGANDANDVFNVSLTVLDHATPSFSNASDVMALPINFGTVTTASATQSINFDVFNRGTNPAFTANMDFDSLMSSGNTSVLTTNAAAFAGSLVLAGGASQMFSALLNTAATGTFAAIYTLRFSDENIAGAHNNKDITLSVSGTVVLAGDFDRDGNVDASDYVVWRKTNGFSTSVFSGADADGSGFVDATDLNWWRQNFGMTATAGSGGLSNVPEPAGVVLAMIGLAAVCRFARTRFTRIGARSASKGCG